MAPTERFDVVIVGAGSGLTAAYHAGRDGKTVAVVEARPEAYGGTCVNRGCIPTKGLIRAAEVMSTVRAAGDFGIELDQGSVRVDFASILRTVRERRASDASGTRAWAERDFTPFDGRARFVGDALLEMEDGRRLTGERIFLATGARPAIPPLEGLDDIDYWTNETVLEQTERPDSLLVLGGGYVGCELGHFFAALGTRVTLVDEGDCLADEDDDVRLLFTREFARRVDLRTGRRAVASFLEKGRPGLVLEGNGTAERCSADRLLIAAGRRPNTDDLGLDATGVETDAAGWIRVDDRLRTAHPAIYAYGDVIGRGMFKHTSSYEGELAYRNSQGADRPVSYEANPHAVFTEPEIGSVGLTERACRERDLRFTTSISEYGDVARGRILGSPAGLAKAILEEGTGRILGFHVVGPRAADLIHEVVVAMGCGAGTAAGIRQAIHVHPTLPELVRHVFDAAG